MVEDRGDLGLHDLQQQTDHLVDWPREAES